MNTLKDCMELCPIVRGLEIGVQEQLLLEHRKACLDRRVGQLGLLCGLPSGEDKNNMTRAALAASRTTELVQV